MPNERNKPPMSKKQQDLLLVAAIVGTSILSLILFSGDLTNSLLPQPSLASEAPYTEHKNLSYLDDNLPEHKLDLYLPAKNGQAPLPVVIFIHGGGCRSGDKEESPSTLLVRNGMAAATINYRLAPSATYPAQLDDCKAAIKWIIAHADQYGLDVHRVILWGASAGGHLASLVALSDPTLKLKAVCDWCGPSNLESIASQTNSSTVLPWSGPESCLELFLGGPVTKKRELAHKASPINYCSHDSPPFLIMHGDQDEMVPLKQSLELRDAITKAGGKVDLFVIPGGKHNFGSRLNLFKVMDFFKTQFVTKYN